MKKNKSSLSLEENSCEPELPDGWIFSTVAECFSDIKNGTIIQQNKERKGIPVSRIETIQKGKFDLNRIQYIENPSPELIKNFQYKIGDIAFSHINSLEHVGKTALYDGKPELFLHGMNLLRLRISRSDIYPKFAYYFMQTNFFRDEVRNRVGKAVNQVSINQKNLATVPFLIAPLAEQHRIVARVEAVLTQVNVARDRLCWVPLIIKKFRQAVLAAACSGHLTEEWRSSQCEWEIVQFDDILERNPQNGIYLPQSMYGSGYPIIRIEDYHNGFLKSWSTLKRVQLSQDTAEKYSLDEDDILINRVNSMKFLGKSILIPKHDEITVFECNMIRFKVNKKRIYPNFASLYLLSPQGLKELRKDVKHAVNQSSINQTDIRAIPFPLPPLAEQHEIVRRVGMLFERADAIEREIAAAGRRCERLTQAVLRKAFSGKL